MNRWKIEVDSIVNMTRLVLFLIFIVFANQSQGYVYGANSEIYSLGNVAFETQNFDYDATSKLRSCCNSFLNGDLQEEIRIGSFFAFFGVLDATKGAGWFDDIARSATRNPDSSRLVLGHFANQGTSYQKVAAHYNATYFKVENWAAVAKGLSQNQIWKINETFLTQQLRQGKQVLFSHNPLKAKSGSFFEREVNFMRELGYSFRQKNQWTWEAVR